MNSTVTPPAAGEAAHTPTFTAEYGRSTNGDAMPVYIKKNGVTVAEMTARDNSAEKAHVASEIVRACNSHAALTLERDACRQTIASLERGQDELVKSHAALVAAMEDTLQVISLMGCDMTNFQQARAALNAAKF